MKKFLISSLKIGLGIFIEFILLGISAVADESIQAIKNNSTSDQYSMESTVQSSSPTITETRITTDPSESSFQDICGDKIVWQDDRYWSGNMNNWNIYMYNISTSKETQITDTGSAWYPSIYEDKIAWQDELNGSNICLYNISTQKKTQITTNGSAYHPDIYGDKIVWTDCHNESEDIYMYNLSTQKKTQIFFNIIVCDSNHNN